MRLKKTNKKDKSNIYEITKNEIDNCQFIKINDDDSYSCCFYAYICEQLGLDWEKIVSIDCRKIDISKNIQESWYEYIDEHNFSKQTLTTMLLISGPKVSSQLNDYEIRLAWDCIEGYDLRNLLHCA